MHAGDLQVITCTIAQRLKYTGHEIGADFLDRRTLLWANKVFVFV